MDRWKKEVRRSEKRKSENEEDTGALKGRKVAIHWFLPMFCGSGGLTNRLAKAAGVEPPGDETLKYCRRYGAKRIWKSKN